MISINERKPPRNVDVLVLWGSCFYVMHRNAATGLWCDNDGRYDGIAVNDITHWDYLPEIPEEAF